MIVVTGAAGFIGSVLAKSISLAQGNDLVLVDDFSIPSKKANYASLAHVQFIHRDKFIDWLKKNGSSVDQIFHLGARTDTTLKDEALFDRLNLNYTKAIWQLCAEHEIPLLYASSAATYGNGEFGYEDAHEIVPKLNPLNDYGWSKQHFDHWALEQSETPPKWYGIKFFNVYGPNEYHKGRMASVVWHCYNQIHESGKMKLFRSHHPEFADGEQKRDFIYVKDAVDICLHLMNLLPDSGLYNAGTGNARTFKDLVNAVFKAMKLEAAIEFIDTPEDIRYNYQYFTEANMDKLLATHYQKPFYSLEYGVEEYVRDYLLEGRYF